MAIHHWKTLKEKIIKPSDNILSLELATRGSDVGTGMYLIKMGTELYTTKSGSITSNWISVRSKYNVVIHPYRTFNHEIEKFFDVVNLGFGMHQLSRKIPADLENWFMFNLKVPNYYHFFLVREHDIMTLNRPYGDWFIDTIRVPVVGMVKMFYMGAEYDNDGLWSYPLIQNDLDQWEKIG